MGKVYFKLKKIKLYKNSPFKEDETKKYSSPLCIQKVALVIYNINQSLKQVLKKIFETKRNKPKDKKQYK